MRPVSVWHNVIGQRRSTRLLQRMIDGSRTLGRVLQSVLMLGASGLGKSHLAQAIAAAIGTTLHLYLCTAEITIDELAELVAIWSAGDVVFLDEVHNLSRPVQEALFSILDAQNITVLAATDRPGTLLSAFKKRFPLRLDLHPYSQREMVAIVRQRAADSNVLLTAQAAKALAQTCRGAPRIARHQLNNLTAYFGANSPREFTSERVRQFLAALEIDALGLGRADRQYMKVLDERQGRGVSLHYLALRLSIDEAQIANDIEPYLVQNGLIVLDRRGRLLSTEGLEYIHEKHDG